MKQIHEERGGTIQEIVIPFTDGIKGTQIGVNLVKAIESNGREIVREMEKFVVLSLIDQEWKEHLRDMDDLKQSVQNAAYEQKDPLLVYKFESVELFKKLMSKVNFETISFLVKSFIPQDEQPPQPQRPVRQAEPELHTNREDEELGEVGGPNAYAARQTEKAVPVRAIKIADRNQKVTVQYRDGRVVKDVKYKKVEHEVERGDCVVIA